MKLVLIILASAACGSPSQQPADAAPRGPHCTTNGSGGCVCDIESQPATGLACKQNTTTAIACCATPGWPSNGQCTCEQQGGCGLHSANLCTCDLGEFTDGHDIACPAPTAGHHCCKTSDSTLGGSCSCSPDACPTNDPNRTWTEVPICNLEIIDPCSKPDVVGKVSTRVDSCSAPGQ